MWNDQALTGALLDLHSSVNNHVPPYYSNFISSVDNNKVTPSMYIAELRIHLIKIEFTFSEPYVEMPNISLMVMWWSNYSTIDKTFGVSTYSSEKVNSIFIRRLLHKLSNGTALLATSAPHLLSSGDLYGVFLALVDQSQPNFTNLLIFFMANTVLLILPYISLWFVVGSVLFQVAYTSK